MNAPACVYCGCTEDRACPGGCSWATLLPPMCSACVTLAQNLHRRLADVLISGQYDHDRQGLALAALDWLCRHPRGPRVRLDRWRRPGAGADGFHRWEDPACGGCQLAAMMRRRSPPGGVGATAGCADHEGRSKTPARRGAATPGKRLPKPTRRPPRSKTNVSETGGRRRG